MLSPLETPQLLSKAFMTAILDGMRMIARRWLFLIAFGLLTVAAALSRVHLQPLFAIVLSVCWYADSVRLLYPEFRMDSEAFGRYFISGVVAGLCLIPILVLLVIVRHSQLAVYGVWIAGVLLSARVIFILPATEYARTQALGLSWRLTKEPAIYAVAVGATLVTFGLSSGPGEIVGALHIRQVGPLSALLLAQAVNVALLLPISTAFLFRLFQQVAMRRDIALG